MPISRPTWAYYSEYNKNWIWRNILLPGEIEDDENGVNYPFLNGSHYPYSNFTFLLTTPFVNINTTVPVIKEPLKDNCE